MLTAVYVSRIGEGVENAVVPLGRAAAYALAALLAVGLLAGSINCSQAKSFGGSGHAEFVGGVLLSLKKSHHATAFRAKRMLPKGYGSPVNPMLTVSDILAERPPLGGGNVAGEAVHWTCRDNLNVWNCPGFIDLLESARSAWPGSASAASPSKNTNALMNASNAPVQRYVPGTGIVIVGAASMYNPYLTEETPHGAQTASGELYNPIAWTAAVQIDLRKEFGGVYYGQNYRPAYALVEIDGKQAIVKINDVGPLKPGRVIDFSQQAMDYFDPSLRRGVIEGALVTPLAGDYWTAGPIGPTRAMNVANLIE